MWTRAWRTRILDILIRFPHKAKWCGALLNFQDCKVVDMKININRGVSDSFVSKMKNYMYISRLNP